MNNKILKAILEGLLNALDFTLDDFDDNDEDLYIKKKKQSIEELEQEDNLHLLNKFNRYVEKIINAELLTDKELEDFNWLKKIYLYSANNLSLRHLAENSIFILGNECDLNWINVSSVTNMTALFYKSTFNGDISKWDVSRVKSMHLMFANALFFNGDISNWNVSKVENMRYMFYHSIFNRDISNWDISNVSKIEGMFEFSKFNQDISKWDISKVENNAYMFYQCPIKEEYKPKKI